MQVISAGREIDIDESIERYSLKENKSIIDNRSRSKAQYLVDKFKQHGCYDAEDSFYFFIKCFRRIPERRIWDIFAIATGSSRIYSPIKYFIRACCNEMK